jgi:hypothetical protein
MMRVERLAAATNELRAEAQSRRAAEVIELQRIALLPAIALSSAREARQGKSNH